MQYGHANELQRDLTRRVERQNTVVAGLIELRVHGYDPGGVALRPSVGLRATRGAEICGRRRVARVWNLLFVFGAYRRRTPRGWGWIPWGGIGKVSLRRTVFF